MTTTTIATTIIATDTIIIITVATKRLLLLLLLLIPTSSTYIDTVVLPHPPIHSFILFSLPNSRHGPLLIHTRECV